MTPLTLRRNDRRGGIVYPGTGSTIPMSDRGELLLVRVVYFVGYRKEGLPWGVFGERMIEEWSDAQQTWGVALQVVDDEEGAELALCCVTHAKRINGRVAVGGIVMDYCSNGTRPPADTDEPGLKGGVHELFNVASPFVTVDADE